MENKVKAEANLNIEVNSPCPKCSKGHLVPFLRARYKNEGSYGELDFDHYEIYYRCSNCNYFIEG